MIASVLRLSFCGLGSLLLSWAAFLLLPSVSERWIAAEEAWFSGAFPPELGRGGVRETASPGLAGDLFRRLPVGAKVMPRLERILRRRTDCAVSVLPIGMLAFAVSFLSALLARERLRFGTGYASPTVSFLAKRLAEGSVLAFFLLTYSPLPLPYWASYPALGALVLGTLGYVSNLPLRL